MSKFTEEQRELINQTRSQIVELNKQQNKLYYDLLRDLNINIYAEDWMFDYIYNESGSIEEIEKRGIQADVERRFSISFLLYKNLINSDRINSSWIDCISL